MQLTRCETSIYNKISHRVVHLPRSLTTRFDSNSHNNANNNNNKAIATVICWLIHSPQAEIENCVVFIHSQTHFAILGERFERTDPSPSVQGPVSLLPVM